MEIKINREIREYKENMFSGCRCGSSFFCAGLRCCRRYLFRSAECAGYGNGQLAVYPRRGSLCCHGLCKIPRYDGGKFVIAWVRSEFLIPRRLTFKPKNLYREAMQEAHAKAQKRH